MKKYRLFPTIFAAALLSVAAFVACSPLSPESYVESANESFTADAQCLTLTVDADSAALTVTATEEEFLTVNYYSGENIRTSVTQDETAITITQTVSQPFLNRNAGEILISIPRNSIETFTVRLNAGESKISDLKCETLNVHLDAGNLVLDNVEADNLTAEVNAGNVEGKNIKANTLKGNVDAGKIALTDTEADKIELTVDTGDIRAELKGEKSEYTLSGEVSVGNKNFDDQTGTTTKSVHAKVSVGSITLTFRNV